MEHIKINEVLFLLDKQPRRYRPGITGGVFAVHYGELPEEKRQLWTDKGYSIINDSAEARHNNEGLDISVAFIKELWKVLFNRPSTLLVWAKEVNDNLLGVIKFCLTHDIKVGLEDNSTGIKALYEPVCDLYNVDLFKTFKIDNLTPETVSKENLEKFRHNKQVLEEARRLYMKPVWENVNDTLEGLLEAVKLHKLEIAPERAIKADRARTQALLREVNSNYTLFVYHGFIPKYYSSTLDDEIPRLLSDVQLWAPAFDLDFRMTPESTVTTYPLLDEIEVSSWSAENKLTNYQYQKRLSRIRRKLQGDQLNWLLTLTVQIEYYKSDIDTFLSDKYYICQCGKPVHKHSLECSYCGTLNDDYIIILNLTPERKQLLEAMTPEKLHKIELKYNGKIDLDNDRIVIYLAEETEDKQYWEAP